MAKKKEVTVKEENLPAAIDFGADQGAGFEEADQSAYAIPFLYVLQSNSPQCKKSDGAYIKGAEEGMFYNTVTGEIFDGDKGVMIIPCHYTRSFNEWQDRNEGGGLVDVHSAAVGEELLATTERNDKGKDILPNGNTLVDTRNHYCLLVREDGTTEPIFTPFSSTQIKKSKKWMTLMNNIKINGFQAPMFSQIYHMTTVPESNDHGSWFGLKIEHHSQITDAQAYADAKAFREMVRSGAAKPADTEEKVPF